MYDLCLLILLVRTQKSERQALPLHSSSLRLINGKTLVHVNANCGGNSSRIQVHSGQVLLLSLYCEGKIPSITIKKNAYVINLSIDLGIVS